MAAQPGDQHKSESVRPEEGEHDEAGEDASSSPQDDEGLGPRFKTGSNDLDQLEGIKTQQTRSRKARRQHEQNKDVGDDPSPDQTYPLIDEIKKSQRRVKNRFGKIKDYGDALDEFGS